MVKTNKPKTCLLSHGLYFQFFVYIDSFLWTRPGLFNFTVLCRTLSATIFLWLPLFFSLRFLDWEITNKGLATISQHRLCFSLPSLREFSIAYLYRHDWNQLNMQYLEQARKSLHFTKQVFFSFKTDPEFILPRKIWHTF